MSDGSNRDHLTGDEIAIIGMAGRFPGAPDVDAFWRQLLEGREGIVRLEDEELLAAGVDPREIAHPRYVKAAPLLDGHDRFDAPFFGYSPLEAEVMDPQQRVLLEVAWQALEDAGHDPARQKLPVGVFAGSKTNTYLFHLASRPEALRGRDMLQLILGGDQALLATRISYKLDLTGPSYAVQTACSTSLVAVHLACRSLLLDECRVALAGGVALNVPHHAGYRYDEGGILSPDGHCRPFDADAAGTVFGSGAGMVVLKRLADARADGDDVRALILGSATNNDGSDKATFTAPSVEGQSQVILEALADAGVDADSIGLVEAHGTGTKLGDPIEVLALKNAWRASTARRNFCALGSVKGNVGHLDAAAGMPGLAKVVKALQTGRVPATLHYTAPNPGIDFDDSPFFVAGEAVRLEGLDGAPRRAALSSLGFGGTNAHLVLEEAPPAPAGEAPSRAAQLLLVSGRTPEVVDAAAERLAARLEAAGESLGPQAAGPYLADAAWTLQTGRRGFEHRRGVVAASPAEAARRLRSGAAEAVEGRLAEAPRAVFLFPGQGAQYPGMGRGLYATEPVFRDAVDRCAAHLEEALGFDLKDVLFPAEAGEEAAGERLRHTSVAQPALLVVEHALAELWRSWGIEPVAMIGHSVGEYTAAVLAGVLSLEDALDLVALRGRLMGDLPGGAMAAVDLPAAEVEELLAGDDGEAGVELAAMNSPRRTVVTGSDAAVDAFARRVAQRHPEDGEGAVRLRRLHTSHAFHSRAMEPILDEFRSACAAVELSPPQRPFVSNLTGTWITAEEATDPGYWARHLRRPVRFAEGLATLLAGGPADRGGRGAAVLLEVGPGTGLGTFSREVAAAGQGDGVAAVAPSLPHPRDRRDDGELILSSLGRAWAAGLEPDWPAFHGGARRRRVPLPVYPFDVSGERHWIELTPAAGAGGAGTAADSAAASATPQADPRVASEGMAAPASVTLERLEEPADWLYRPDWRPAELAEAGADVFTAGETVAVFVPRAGLAEDGPAFAASLVSRLEAAGARVVTVEPGDGYERLDADRFRVAAGSVEDHRRLLDTLAAAGRWPRRLVHLWTLADGGAADGGFADGADAGRRRREDHGFWALLALARALAAGGYEADLTVATHGAADLGGEATDLVPEHALMQGPVKVLPKEHPEVSARLVDVAGVDLAGTAAVDALFAEISAAGTDPVVAWRGGRRFAESFAPLAADEETAREAAAPLLRRGGTYLITGGLGGVGSVLAAHLAREWDARLVLTGRSELPPREEWDDLSAAGGEDPAAVRVRRVRELEALGAEVLPLAADAADRQAMEAAVEAARQRFGRIDGVIHAAGVAGGGLLQLKSEQAARAVLDPKVEGARVLTEIFDAAGADDAGDGLDFLLFVSSLQSVLADFGQVDYAGASAYLDALAARRDAAGHTTLSLDFDNWREVGLLVEVGLPPHLEPWREELLGKALASDEAVAVVARLLAEPRPRVAVSTQDLLRRVELSRRLTRDEILQQIGSPASGGAGDGAGLPAGTSAAEVGRRVQAVWRRVLGLGDFDPAENFFDLGGDSLSGMQLVSELSRELGVDLSPVDLYDTPSVAAMVERLTPAAEESGAGPAPAATLGSATSGAAPADDGAVAIVGMACRLPGAAAVGEFWANLASGKESIRFFDDGELAAAGVPADVLSNPRYVPARAVLGDVDRFDAGFFGYTPREAEVMDPQHRVFLEVAWEAMEDAGFDPARQRSARVGVYAGSSISTYLQNLYADPDLRREVDDFHLMLGNEKDSLPTRVSYKLNLKGPSMAVQTYCSTSLVAVHTARRALLAGECDLALAGGVSIQVPETRGYLHDEGSYTSGDGHVRAFDAAAEGIVWGNGAGAVVLKKLDRALADGDPVYALIRGSAVNNDGAMKAGFVAPSVEGQAAVVSAALEDAGVDAREIGFVEAHGTGTPLGDPIEIAALTRAYRRHGDGRGWCAVGSVKSNFGHLDRAAGVTSLIKATLALGKRQIPPTLHFSEPSPKIDFAASPFYVNAENRPFPQPAGGGPRRAAVSALGVGGTNAHVVLEEAPPLPATEPAPREDQLLVLSAHSGAALDAAADRLATVLEADTGADLADVAWTLQTGRRTFRHRLAVTARDAAGAARALTAGRDETPRDEPVRGEAPEPRSATFLLPGLGGQYPGMGADLYLGEPAFRRAVDRAAEILQPILGDDLRQVIYPGGAEAWAEGGERRAQGTGPAGGMDLRRMLGRDGGAGGDGGDGSGATDAERARLARTRHSQPAVFVMEYALARLWQDWGVAPAALAGYSIGEITAACLAGVLDLEDALALVARRALLIEDLPGGAMLAVPMAEDDVAALLGDDLSLSAVNGPQQSVVAGPEAAVAALEERLAADGVACRRLQTSHAFHSHMMQEVAEPLEELVSGFELRPPQVPYLSNVTGTWITADQATDPSYWARHARNPVRFSAAVEALAADPDRVYLEVGPGQVLGALLLQHPATTPAEGSGGEAAAPPPVVASLRHDYQETADGAFLQRALGRLWVAGVEPDWRGLHDGARRRRVALPTYPFQRRSYWIGTAAAAPVGREVPAGPVTAPAGVAGSASRQREAVHSGQAGGPQAPTWKRAPLTAASGATVDGPVLILADAAGLGDRVAEALEAAGRAVLRAVPGDAFSAEGDRFTVRPADVEDWSRLVEALPATPADVLHLWSLDGGPAADGADDALEAARRRGLSSALLLAQALWQHNPMDASRLWIATGRLRDVLGDETPDPARATILGAARAVPEWFPSLACRAVDLDLPAGNVSDGALERASEQLVAELAAPAPAAAGAPAAVAWRGRSRWVRHLDAAPEAPDAAVEAGLWLVVGGLEDPGFAFARALAQVPGVRLGLIESETTAAAATGRVSELEATDAEVQVVGADPGDGAALTSALGRLCPPGAPLAGVLYAAPPVTGDPGEEDPQAGFEAVGRELQERAAALLALDGALAPAHGAFRLLVSSHTSPRDPGWAAQLALEGFLDALAMGGDGATPWARVALAGDAAGGDLCGPETAETLFDLAAAGVPSLRLAPRAAAAHLVSVEPASDAAADAPQGDLEVHIAAIWRELLGVPRVGRHDDFLALGGDSLLATRLIARLRDSYRVELPVRLFFQGSTVAELAAAVEEARGGAAAGAPAPAAAAADETDQEELMRLLETMSEDEVEAELARRGVLDPSLQETGS